MLLGPYNTQEQAMEVCGISSSSSSSCSSEPCPVSIFLASNCGIEISNGSIYSIGTQQISISSFTDDCECIEQILINDHSVPYHAVDGELLDFSLILNSNCYYDSQNNPTCLLPLFGVSDVRGSKLRMRLLPGNISKYLLSRRRATGFSGK